jgi:hypothetical protein
VGFGVGFGVGLGVGCGVGLGVGATITTGVGATAVRAVERLPLPFVAAKLYVHEPAGRDILTEYVTPAWNVVPAPVIAKRPSPAITTSTFDGLQPPLSVNRTEKVTVVEGEPEPGDAFPAVSVGVVDPLQLPARAAPEVVGRTRTIMATAMASRTELAVRTRIG